MKLSKGIFYSRTSNINIGIMLHKGRFYISVMGPLTPPTPVVELKYYCLYLVPLTYSVTEKALTYSVTQAPLVYSIEEVSKCTR